MDAITLLKNDHKTVEKLFKQFEKTGKGAVKTRLDLAQKIIEELSIHAAIEEKVLYPAIRAAVPDADDTVLEALEEHHVAKWLLAEIEAMDPTDERFKAKVMVLIESVRHHVEEEEQELFPEVRKELGRKALGEIGEALEAAKKEVPPRPQPMEPDEPPANLTTGTQKKLSQRAKAAAVADGKAPKGRAKAGSRR